MITTTPIDTLDAPMDLEARFESFVANHRDRAVRMAWRLVGGDDAAAEDVAQDALARAWRALPRFREESQLSTWFYRILVRQAANHRRWRDVRRRFASGEDVETLPRRELSTDPALRERIRRAIDELPRGQREAFVLVHLEGHTAREAADLTGRREGTIKSHLNRARQALRRDLHTAHASHPLAEG